MHLNTVVRLVAWVIVIVPSLICVAATFNVPADVPTMAGALSVASSGDTILVSPGTYTQNLNFGGKAIALRSTSGPDVTKIKVNGGIGVQIRGPAEISGFTISGAVSD